MGEGGSPFEGGGGIKKSRCNMEMVALERMGDSEDLDLVRGLMERHLEYTGSAVAEGLLGDWPQAAERFVKVMPLDYRRSLEEQREGQKTRGGGGAGEDG